MTGRTESPRTPGARLFAMLLLVYPKSFRRIYREDLLDFFCEQRRDPRHQKGWAGRLGFWVEVMGDALRNAARLRSRTLYTAWSPAPGRKKKKTRSSRRGEPMSQDIRHAFRRLAKSPGFALAAVLTLGLGIGANTAIFSVVHAVVISPLPYPDSDRLLELWHTAPGADIASLGMSFGTYLHYRELNHTFEDVSVYQTATVNLTGDGQPQRTGAAYVTSSFFNLFQAPVLGRGITEPDDLPGADPVVVISYRLWRQRYGGSSAILGRSILLDGDAFEVVGVMPARFDFPTRETDLWLAAQIDPAQVTIGGFSPLGIGRLRPGVTPEEAQADLVSLVPRLEDRFPGRAFDILVHNAGLTPRVTLLKEKVLGNVDRMLWILLGTVGFVLLIACANVANLFLVRAEARRREVAVRSALGAGRGRMVRYFLTESVILALIGGVLGLLFAFVGVKALVQLGPVTIPRLHEVAISPLVLAFTAVLSVFSGLAFGVVPVLRLGTPKLLESLKDGGRGPTFGRERRRTVLVVSQITLAFVLLIGAGLMVRSFWNLRSLNPGFDAERVLTFRVSLPTSDYPDQETAARFQQRLLDRLGGLPGVQDVGAIQCLPLTGCRNVVHLVREGVHHAPDEMPPPAEVRGVTDGYFRTLRIPLIEGRVIERSDHEQQTGAVVVSQAFAEHFWPAESAIGKRINTGGSRDRWYEIVGVVADVPWTSLTEEPVEVVYVPLVGTFDDLHRPDSLAFTVKVSGSPLELAGAVRREIAAMDPNLPVANLQSLESLVSQARAPTAFAMLLLGIAAFVALLLGAIGVYGVLSYMVSQRKGEIGVRMALGANGGQVSRMILRLGIGVGVVGVALGLGGALLLTRMMGAMLFNVHPNDLPTYCGVSAALLVVTLVASYLPARRAANQDPSEALRFE